MKWHNHCVEKLAADQSLKHLPVGQWYNVIFLEYKSLRKDCWLGPLIFWRWYSRYVSVAMIHPSCLKVTFASSLWIRLSSLHTRQQSCLIPEWFHTIASLVKTKPKQSSFQPVMSLPFWWFTKWPHFVYTVPTRNLFGTLIAATRYLISTYRQSSSAVYFIDSLNVAQADI